MKIVFSGSHMNPSRFIFAIISVLLSWHATQAGRLTTTLCSIKLPQPMAHISALFDQDDTIYLFGGFEGAWLVNHTLKYSISVDTLESAGQLPIGSVAGATVMNKFGNIFHLPGTEAKPIFQYFPVTQSFTTVGNLVNDSYGCATVIPDQDTALFFGGLESPQNGFSLNLNTLEYERLPPMPVNVFWAAGIWVHNQNAAYIFNERGRPNVKYLRSSSQFQLLENKIPLGDLKAVVWDGRFGYLIGNNAEIQDWGSLVQFDPDTGNFTLIPVENFPAVAATAAVYVEKLVVRNEV